MPGPTHSPVDHSVPPFSRAQDLVTYVLERLREHITLEECDELDKALREFIYDRDTRENVIPQLVRLRKKVASERLEVFVPVGDAALTAHLRLECNHLERGPPTLSTLQQRARHPTTHAGALSKKDHWEVAYRWWLVQALETLADDYDIHLDELGRLYDALNRLRRAPQPQGSDPHAHRMWDPDYLSGEESPHSLGTTSRAGTLRRDAIYGFRVPSM